MDEKKTYRRLAEHAAASEKALERYLAGEVRAKGGECLKYFNATNTGWPDRIAMMPGGVVAWVELKSKGKHPTPLQSVRLNRLREMHFTAVVADCPEDIDSLVAMMAAESRRLTGKEAEE